MSSLSPAPAAFDRPPRGREVHQRMIWPLATRIVSGLTWHDGSLLALDGASGRVGVLDPDTDDLRVCNDGLSPQFRGARGLAVAAGRMWTTTDRGVISWGVGPDGRSPQGSASAFWSGDDAESVAVAGDLVYVVHRQPARLVVRRLADASEVGSWPLHGIGRKAISVCGDRLWLVDRAEQTAYCWDRTHMVELFRVPTPQEEPTAIAAGPDPADLLVAYHADEPFIADDPWSEPNWVLRYRDRALIQPLHTAHDPARRRAYSTGYRVAMEYFVEIDPDDDRSYEDLRWRIGLPLETARQHVVSVCPVGAEMTVEQVDGQPFAEFTLGHVDGDTRRLVGWRAVLDIFGIKHLIGPRDCPARELPDGMAAKYLVDDYDLAMAAPSVIDAAAQAAGRASDPVTTAHNIRNWVYDHVDYEMGNADDPAAVLARGTGSCGEYVGVLMALTRLNGLASRAAGRYKVPYASWTRGVPLYPDFNHAWLDLYLPGLGWVPIESNPDDTDDGGPYPDRFFLGLPWRHIELTKDVSFESVTHVSGGRRRRASAGRLSRNHIRFQVLAELAPELG